ncbi:peptide deacylase [Liquorilactobacillus sucicola DSM 21376 = JCM 15457]|uniref:Peptide deacylase n=1 Tax=Liquorilactobacillus sucicola DSM 21376 = JCM 15457 TaxID=1423806 RepID=A0A0R2DQA5_9LACO|nr:M20/M25/M40 family metallo-hydrolase [Liquorilactobacillus sucicola]KRN06256.1 peptide deacylase [Liquorilactobacillus sucicola DSM 21376 = JCM 15457]
MYQKLEKLLDAQRVEALTRELVSVKSVNGTSGEVAIAAKVESILRSFPFFQQHPEWVWTQELVNDRLGRKNVFAFIKKDEAAKTIIYHSHMDTVGIEDFGALKEAALDSDKLTEYFKKYSEDPDIQKDACSGDWLFGRGALDMKSGDAVNLTNLLYYSEHPQEMAGNLLFMGNCVEENDHSGAIAALDELEKLKKQYHLSYEVAINTDFISPKYEGDQQKYIYYGAAGKALTCFYIKGIETHVGNTYAGIDSTLIASRINLLLNNNPEFVEDIPDEEVLPSSCLMLRDQKDFYNVQTAKTTHMYFNTFTYKRPVYEILQHLKVAVEHDCHELVKEMIAKQAAYLKKLSFPAVKDERQIRVYTFAEYLDYLKQEGVKVEELVHTFWSEHQEADKREIGFALLDYLDKQINDNTAKVILFLAPPFCPHNSVAQDSHVYQKLKTALAAYEQEEAFKMKQFFPYLSDSSYLAIDETDAEIDQLTKNFPLVKEIYPLPYDKMRLLNIPAVDIGVFGKGAHTWKERVYKPYSFEFLPKLIREFTTKMWEK